MAGVHALAEATGDEYATVVEFFSCAPHGSCATRSQLRKSMEVLGCQSWDVGVVLTTDEEVRQLNAEVTVPCVVFRAFRGGMIRGFNHLAWLLCKVPPSAQEEAHFPWQGGI